jgi:hypothetical protein
MFPRWATSLPACFLLAAERWRSPAAESGSGADAGGSQVQCDVMRHLHRCDELPSHADCGKPVVQFLKRVEKKLKSAKKPSSTA